MPDQGLFSSLLILPQSEELQNSGAEHEVLCLGQGGNEQQAGKALCLCGLHYSPCGSTLCQWVPLLGQGKKILFFWRGFVLPPQTGEGSGRSTESASQARTSSRWAAVAGMQQGQAILCVLEDVVRMCCCALASGVCLGNHTVLSLVISVVKAKGRAGASKFWDSEFLVLSALSLLLLCFMGFYLDWWHLGIFYWNPRFIFWIQETLIFLIIIIF